MRASTKPLQCDEACVHAQQRREHRTSCNELLQVANQAVKHGSDHWLRQARQVDDTVFNMAVHVAIVAAALPRNKQIKLE